MTFRALVPAKPAASAVDRREWGHRVMGARTDNGWTQNELAMKLRNHGVNTAFISKLETGTLGFRTGEVWERACAVSKFLALEIPYVSPAAKVAVATPVVARAAEAKAEVMPAGSLKEQDPELSALVRCSQSLERIHSHEGRLRVLDYLNRRYGFGFGGGE